METGIEEKHLSIRFGSQASSYDVSHSGIRAHIPLPVLGGNATETLWPTHPDAEPERCGRFLVLRGPGVSAGIAMIDIGEGSLEKSAHDLYAELLGSAARDHSIHRIWNFVPSINDKHEGLENYRAFNIGRHAAFASAFGSSAELHMPAASAVGNADHHLVVAFIAGKQPVRYVENPEQTPAYRYPRAYGPQPPSFARGSIVEHDGRIKAYVSGTASIKGHRTIANGNVLDQFSNTMENIGLVLREMAIPDIGETADIPECQARVYLRNAADLEILADAIATRFPFPGSGVLILETDICRPDLDVEIEMTFHAGR